MKNHQPKQQKVMLETWFGEFQGPLLRYFKTRIPPDVDANDFVQEVFIRLARRGDLSEIEQVKGYLFQTASSVLKDHYRSRQSHATDLHDSFQSSEHDSQNLSGITPERVILAKEQVQVLLAALHELPERTRIVFVLYHFEDLRQLEISKRLEISLRTVERHMAAALAHILTRLK